MLDQAGLRAHEGHEHSPSHAKAQWLLEYFARIPLRGQRRIDLKRRTGFPFHPGRDGQGHLKQARI